MLDEHGHTSGVEIGELSHVDLDISRAMQYGTVETRPEHRCSCEIEFARKCHDDAAVELELDDLGSARIYTSSEF